jgi:hypothetical protein
MVASRWWVWPRGTLKRIGRVVRPGPQKRKRKKPLNLRRGFVEKVRDAGPLPPMAAGATLA